MTTPDIFKPKICTQYPPENVTEYERWFGENFVNRSKYEYLNIYWTAYYVNNQYGQNKEAIYILQRYLNELDTSKKYFTIIQYDDSILNDVSHLDLIRFEMSKKIGYQLPLMAQPHSYVPTGKKKYFASFIGSRTHPLRDKVFALEGTEGYYISASHHSINLYCKIVAESIFGLCPRGYGMNSFRIVECMQYNTIPVYLSNEFIFPHNLDFLEYGVIIEEKDADRIDEILRTITPEQIIMKQDRIKELYHSHFTYQGCQEKIMEHLLLESSM